MDSVKFNLGDTVYLIINACEPGMVTGILYRPNCVRYYVSWGNANETVHFDIELTTEKIFDSATA